MSFRGDAECLDYGIKEHLLKDIQRLMKEML